MFLGMLPLLIGLLASMVFVMLSGVRSLIKITTCGFAVYLSVMTLFCYFLNSINVSLTTPIFLAIFFAIITLELLYIKRYDKKVLVQVRDEPAIFAGFILIFFTGFLIYIAPSLPSFFPVCAHGWDSAHHYSSVEYIWTTHHLLFGHGGTEIIGEHYPQGYHLNIAALSWFLGIHPIKMIYLVTALITALSASATYGLLAETKNTDKTLSLLAGFLLLTSVFTFVALIFIGWWSLLYGIFLTVAFMWFLMHYRENPSFFSLSILILLEAGIVYAYTPLAPVPAIAFILVLLALSKNKGFKITHFLAFLFFTMLFTYSFSVTLLGQHFASNPPTHALFGSFYTPNTGAIKPFELHRTGYPLWDVVNIIATVTILIALPGFIVSIFRRKNKFAIIFFVSSLLLSSMFLFLTAKTYLYYKTYHLLIYPTAIFIAIGAQDLILRWNWLHKRVVENERLFKTIFVVLLVLGSTVSIGIAYVGIQRSGDELLAISPDQYDVALWVRDNLPSGELPYVAGVATVRWAEIISWHLLNHSLPLKTNTSGVDFDKWYASAKQGDIIVIMDINKIHIDLNEFEIIYNKGNAYVLEKKK